jgi:hypothetical protein
MNDPFRKVRSGEELKIAAEAWNAAMAAAQANQRRGPHGGGGPVQLPVDPAVALVVNSTGVNLIEWAVVALADAAIDAVDSPDAFAGKVAFNGSIPTLPENRDRFGIMVDPVADGEAGRAVVAGVTVCRVDVVDDAHTFARVVEGETGHLETCEDLTGCAILYLAPDVIDEDAAGDVRYALVRIGNPADDSAGQYQFQVKQMVAQNVKGWDMVRAHSMNL